MKTKETELKEGCGKKFMWIDYLKDERACGQIEDLKHSDHIILCPECKGTHGQWIKKEELISRIRENK